MKSIFAFAILAAVMYVCGLGEDSKQSSETPASNTAQAPAKPSPSPTADKQSLQNELMKLVNEMAQASVDGDITLLARHTTDDFELTGADGKVQNKNEALADVKKEKTIKSWAMTEPELVSFSENSAVLRFTLNLTLKTGQSGRARVTDTFVKKDGRWLVKNEQQTMMK